MRDFFFYKGTVTVEIFIIIIIIIVVVVKKFNFIFASFILFIPFFFKGRM